ncbi:WecB/TagA/CpsF family glycosyltransferase [Mycolicibacterium monacense]|uniref:WecB/TagA/CpsF family glycosyltransferase n=1 Tax=Mycolicibacterium monacense TaxID=85693 RepID=UPI0026792ED1
MDGLRCVKKPVLISKEPTNVRVALGSGFVDLATWSDVEQLGAGSICTVAPWQLWVAEGNEGYREALESAKLILPDGNGIILLLALKGIRQHRITGRELVERVAQGTLWPEKTIVVVGASDEARNRLLQRYGWKGYGGRFTASLAATKAEAIWASQREHLGPSGLVYLIALGSPVQEIVGSELLKLDPACVAVGIGGAIETLAGTVPRPPDWVVRLRIEFLYRAVLQPHLRRRVVQALTIEVKIFVRLAWARWVLEMRKRSHRPISAVQRRLQRG